MLHTHSKRKLKRRLSMFLVLILVLGSLTGPAFPAMAADDSVSENHVVDMTADADPPAAFPEDVPDSESTQPVPESAGNTDTGESPVLLDSPTQESTPALKEPDGSLTEMEPDAGSEHAPEEELDQAQANADTHLLIFDYNGGTDFEGRTSYQIEVAHNAGLSDYIKEVNAREIKSPYKFTYKWDMYYTDTNTLRYNNRTEDTALSVKENYTFIAVWSDSYEEYTIDYQLDGGSFTEGSEEEIPYSYTYEGNVTLPTQLQKKGFLFKGFYTDAAFTSDVVTTIQPGLMGDLTLYAKWESAVPASAPKLKKASNPSTGIVNVAFEKMTGISGYELLMSTSKDFKKSTNTLSVKASAASVKLTNMPKGKTYYFKLRACNTDSTGEKAYTKYSNVVKLKITKGVKEYKATASSAKIKNCKLTDSETVSISFTVNKRIKSSDDSYYLVKVDPNTNQYSKKLAQAPKQKTTAFTLPVREENGTDLIQGKFALAVKNGSKYTLISKGSFLSNPEKAASYTGAFPVSRSKKGLQGSTDGNLGLSHTFMNFDLNNVLDGSNPQAYTYNGKTYHFTDPWSGWISACNEAGLTVTGQFMLTYRESTKYMILKSGRKAGKPYYAINVQEKKARETFEAVMSFLAERYGTSDCHLDNWILGNEVNIHPDWYYAGSISQDAFMKNYASTYRIMYYAVKSRSQNSRVYICTDHTWSNRSGDWGAKPFMNAFNTEIKAQNKNIQWNLAYHAYPSILTSSDTWNDILAPNSENADFVSPKNLSVMTNYVKNNFGSKTRIILSEQGFTSTTGNNVQAAAIAYTYYKAEFDDMIDAVIFRSYQDNGGEAAQKLYFGLLDLSGNKKPAYNVFKYMDTKNAEKYTKPYLKTIGISSWKDIAPKYNLKKFK